MGEMAGLDFNSICRLCVQFFEKDKVSPIFNNESYNDKISLPERIKYCSAVEVAEDDGLPTQICDTCLSKLNQSFVFRNQCVLADITLKRLKHISFSSNLIINFLKVDIENQIIQSDKDDFLQEEAENLKNKFRNDEKIDEFDNSKNGRHKRSIHKLKRIPLQKTKILNNNEGTPKCETENVEDAEKGLEKSAPIMNSKEGKEKIKNNLNEERSNNDNIAKMKKIIKFKRVKQYGTNKKNKIDFNMEIKTKNFTVQPKLNSCHNNTERPSLDLDEVTQTYSENIQKPKLFKSKRGKKMKVSYCKEKPSSYKCDHCQKVYPSEGGWRYHIHTMHNENYQPFLCDLCGQAFKVKKNLEVHKNSIHFHLKSHLCDLCGRGFASKYALKVHKIWHNGEKNFTCDVCGTKFRTRGKMNTHRSIHGGPKNFMCHICSRDFRWKKDFEIHMRTHTGEKPFKCSNCGKAFASLSNMKKHEKNHLKKVEIHEITEKEDDGAC